MELSIIEPTDAKDLKAKLKSISEKFKEMSKEMQIAEDFDIVLENNILTLDGKWLLKRQNDKHLSNIQQYIGKSDDTEKMKGFSIEESKVVKEHTGKEKAVQSAFLYGRSETVKGERPKVILSYIDILQDVQQEDIEQWQKNGLELYDLSKIDRKQLMQSTNYTYGIMQRENDRINILLNKARLDQKHFKQYFFYGLENREPILEGIIHGACRDLNSRYLRLNESEQFPSREEKIETLRKRVIEIYQQFYRFINVIEEDDRRFDFRLSASEKQIVENIVNNKINDMLENEMLLIFKRGIFVKDRPDEISEKRKRRTYNTREHIWTDELYGVLKQLEAMEKIDTREYNCNWLEAKFSRLKISKGYTGEKLHELRKPFKEYLERKGMTEEKVQS